MDVNVAFLKQNKVRLTFKNGLDKETLYIISQTMNLIAQAKKGNETIMLTDKVSFNKLVDDKILLFN